jgi:uncharacterized protein YegJ (DUF2314 family)
MPVESDEDRQLAYRTMGMIMATVAFVGVKDDVIAVFDKATNRLAPFDDTVPGRLASDFPESVFAEDAPILSSEGVEQELQKAADEAQSRLPEFVSAFERRGKGGTFGVKAKFQEGDAVEWMWVLVEHVTDNGFEGRLDNNPGQLKRFKAGERITVKPEEVVDWVIKDGKGMRGGFSIEVFKKQQAMSDG